MKKILILLAVLVSGKLIAQTPISSRPTPAALPSREVSGILKDTADNTVAGALITLTSAKDTLKITSNSDGIFVFKNVKMATFYLTISSLGIKTITIKRLENDAVPRLVLAPIILKEEPKQLADVVVNGTPTITYKTDTIEYRAADYKVRENATVEDLIKKMEGIEVDKDGSVTAQGQSVAKARLNGKDYLGGDVATVIRDLPAEVVDKIQIVDDYGDLAARTGIKEGDPSKLLNITTKADKSAMNRGNFNAGIGTNDRYQAGASLTRLNGNQQIAMYSNWNKSPLNAGGSGMPGGSGGFGGGQVIIMSPGRGGDSGGGYSGGGGGFSGGMQSYTPFSSPGGGSGGIGSSTNGSIRLSHSDNLNKKMQSDLSYSYSYSNRDAFSNTTSVANYQNAVLNSLINGTSASGNGNHNLNWRFQYDIDSANYLTVTPNLSYSQSKSESTSSNVQSGLYNQSNVGAQNSTTYTPRLGLNLGYQHIFANHRRNMSFGFDYRWSDQNNDNDSDEDIKDYDANGNLVKATPLHRLIANDNTSTTYSASLTYTEPLGTYSSLNFNTNLNRRIYDNSKITELINAAGVPEVNNDLSNIFNYSFTTGNIVMNYRYGGSGKKASYSLGARAQPSLLEGTSESRNVSVSRSRMYVVPVFRFQYQFTRVKQFALNYNGNPQEPSYSQIQPVRDDTSPLNPVIGNPNLNASFNHSVTGSFSNYIANSKFSYQTNLTGTVTNQKVITNRYTAIEDQVSKQFTEYLNADGAYSLSTNYSIGKSFASRKYGLRLNGSAGYARDVAMVRGNQNFATTWNFAQRFTTQINPVEWFELNPTLSFTNNKRNNTLPSSLNSRTTTAAFSIDGRVIVKDSYILGYDASKSIVRGVNIAANNNPFIVNSYIEKEFFKKKNGTIRLQAADIFNQNVNPNRTLNSDGGYTETQSNPLSRYFLLSFRWSPSKFGSSTRTMGPRRGDGSFIIH
ncbi:MAG: hypothetical protein K0S09_576 [Sphingobacteriaceae bacterium]|jgi:hypothetical protein|nr:hypothetical protein [Sphingobacteriaceae bacterium]